VSLSSGLLGMVIDVDESWEAIRLMRVGRRFVLEITAVVL
jgi:hypothetical protein